MNLEGKRVLNFIYALAVGGTERQFVYATRALHERGLAMHTGVILRKGVFLKDLQALGIPLAEYSTSSMYSYRTVRQQLKLRRDMRSLRIDVLHAYGFYANVFAIPASRLAFAPVIVASVRDTGVYLTPMMRRAQKTACRLAHCVVANSNAVRDWLVNDGLEANRIRVIRNGIVMPEQRPAREFVIRKRYGIPEDAPVVVTVCRVNRSKGLEYLIQAAASVVQNVPEARFLIVGRDGNEPGYKAELEATVRESGLETNVLFLGERNDVSEVLKEANVFVLPSLSEGLSNALLEGMAAALPVVATNVGGNPELVLQGETGFLVAAKSGEALAQAICHLIRNPDLALRFGESGRRRAAGQFSVESMVNQTQHLYADLLSERARLVA